MAWASQMTNNKAKGKESQRQSSKGKMRADTSVRVKDRDNPENGVIRICFVFLVSFKGQLKSYLLLKAFPNPSSF